LTAYLEIMDVPEPRGTINIRVTLPGNLDQDTMEARALLYQDRICLRLIESGLQVMAPPEMQFEAADEPPHYPIVLHLSVDCVYPGDWTEEDIESLSAYLQAE
jgi:hypothetical protein